MAFPPPPTPPLLENQARRARIANAVSVFERPTPSSLENQDGWLVLVMPTLRHGFRATTTLLLKTGATPASVLISEPWRAFPPLPPLERQHGGLVIPMPALHILLLLYIYINDISNFTTIPWP
jgi:hypothetical protein